MNYLVLSLKTLVLGFNFNKKINNLPLSIEKMRLGFYFDRKLTKIPFKMKKIIFINSRFYNRKLPQFKNSNNIETQFKYKN